MVVVVVVIILLTGAKVFATANPESQLAGWFEGKLHPINLTIADRSDRERIALQDSITKYVEGMFMIFKERLDPSSTIKNTEEGIDNHKNRYKAQIEEVKSQLNTDDWETFEEEEKERINLEVELEIEEFLEDYLSN